METGYSKWRKLDNAALAFPLVTDKNDTRVFRFYCQLKEEVNSYFLGEAIRKARLAQNLTQDELGKRVGVQRSQICRLESGRTNITIPVMSRVFQALGIATATLDLGVAGKIALW